MKANLGGDMVELRDGSHDDNNFGADECGEGGRRGAWIGSTSRGWTVAMGTTTERG